MLQDLMQLLLFGKPGYETAAAGLANDWPMIGLLTLGYVGVLSVILIGVIELWSLPQENKRRRATIASWLVVVVTVTVLLRIALLFLPCWILVAVTNNALWVGAVLLDVSAWRACAVSDAAHCDLRQLRVRVDDTLRRVSEESRRITADARK